MLSFFALSSFLCSLLAADQNTTQVSQHGVGADTCTETLDKQGSLVAIARRHDGCVLIDVSNPQNPATVSVIQPDIGTQDIWDVDIHGSYVFLMNRPEAVDSVLNNWVGLYIYDISTPASPTLAGYLLWGGGAWHHLGGSIKAGTVNDINGVPYAFLCSDITGNVEVFDVSNPGAPIYVTSILPQTTYTSAVQVSFQNNLVYIAWGSGGFTVEDVNNPYAPINIIDQAYTGQQVINGGLQTISPTPDGTHVVTGEYTLDGTVRLWKIQGSTAVQTATWELGSGALLWTIRVTNDFAFVAHLEDGIQVLDIRNRNQLTNVGCFDPDTQSPTTTWSGISDIHVEGNRIYAAHQSNGLYVVDFGDSISVSKALWHSRKKRLIVHATSSDQPDRTLTVVGFGDMTWKSRKNRYQLNQRNVNSNPGTITIESDLVGQITVPVTVR